MERRAVSGPRSQPSAHACSHFHDAVSDLPSAHVQFRADEAGGFCPRTGYGHSASGADASSADYDEHLRNASRSVVSVPSRGRSFGPHTHSGSSVHLHDGPPIAAASSSTQRTSSAQDAHASAPRIGGQFSPAYATAFVASAASTRLTASGGQREKRPPRTGARS